MNEEHPFAVPQELVETLRTARHVTVLTGAGKRLQYFLFDWHVGSG